MIINCVTIVSRLLSCQISTDDLSVVVAKSFQDAPSFAIGQAGHEGISEDLRKHFQRISYLPDEVIVKGMRKYITSIETPAERSYFVYFKLYVFNRYACNIGPDVNRESKILRNPDTQCGQKEIWPWHLKGTKFLIDSTPLEFYSIGNPKYSPVSEFLELRKKYGAREIVSEWK